YSSQYASYLQLSCSPLTCLLLYSTYICFFFNDTPLTEIYTLSLHDALPILGVSLQRESTGVLQATRWRTFGSSTARCNKRSNSRSEEHTSELQSRGQLVCRLLLEKKKNDIKNTGAHCS